MCTDVINRRYLNFKGKRWNVLCKQPFHTPCHLYFAYHRLIKLGSYAIIFNATIKDIYIYIYDLTSNYFYKIENSLDYARTR